jgi:hypothetical protein
MTALNFILTEQAVFVLTDSLTLEGGSANRGEARGFFTKVFPLPHMNAAIVGTGVAQVVLDWFLEIQTMVVSDSVAFLDTVAPARLREIAGRYPSAMTTVRRTSSSPSDCRTRSGSNRPSLHSWSDFPRPSKRGRCGTRSSNS